MQGIYMGNEALTSVIIEDMSFLRTTVYSFWLDVIENVYINED